MFTADLYEPDAWAKLFEDAGARYVVLTSKHHDGFTLWPNEQANDRGFAWNSVETGAKRDLAGELSKAVKKTSVKMGFYYSLYEWYHPWWKNDRERFVDEHYLPQIKDLVQKYDPEILWADGEWDMEADKWKSKEFLAWLYNESVAKDHILVNDRWGKGMRQKNGGYYTTEYEAGKEFDKPWEECRGMGFSFGYNQNEDAEDYNSTRTLLLVLIDIVSNGGNLLLDIGPDHRGRIPVIMQQKLKDIGDWLAVNGEAIYNTRTWEKTCQWSEGIIEEPERGSFKSKYDIMELTVNPPPGKATKEIFFTKKENILYAICPIFPDEKLTIKDLSLPSTAKISFLGMDGNLEWQQAGKNVEVMMPVVNPSRMPCEYAYTFKIEKYSLL